MSAHPDHTDRPDRPLPPGVKRFSERPDAKKVWSGVRYDIYQWQQEQFDGTMKTFEVATRADVAVVVPVIGDEIIVLKEKQPHWDDWARSLVGGAVEPGESLEAAARRELEEETGHVFERFTLVDVTYPMPGLEFGVYTFVAHGLKEVKAKHLDAGELTAAERISVAEFIRLARTGGFIYSPLFAEKYLLANEEGKLREVLEEKS